MEFIVFVDPHILSVVDSTVQPLPIVSHIHSFVYIEANNTMKVTVQENSQVDIQISRDMRVRISKDLASKRVLTIWPILQMA